MTLTSRNVLLVVFALVLIMGTWLFLTMPDTRTPTQKIGDAIHDLDQGPDKAARQLEDRTPGQKAGDAIKDMGDDIKRNTSNQSGQSNQ